MIEKIKINSMASYAEKFDEIIDALNVLEERVENHEHVIDLSLPNPTTPGGPQNTTYMTRLIKQSAPEQEERKKIWSCRFHPTDWFHEVGCPHIKWDVDKVTDNDKDTSSEKIELELTPIEDESDEYYIATKANYYGKPDAEAVKARIEKALDYYDKYYGK